MPNKIECCRYCGRDTKNKSRICTTCYQGGNRPRPEHYGRKGFVQHDDMLIRDEGHDYNGPVHIDPYNGATSRDDI